MRAALIAAMLVPAALSAQAIADPARSSRALEIIDAHAGPPLGCEVLPIKPALNFSFRFQAGYVVRVPLNQYSGPGHRWAFLMRITPEEDGSRPVYLVSRVRLPNIPKNNVLVEVGGAYLVGEGRYRVKWVMYDDSGRTCRREWRIEARLRHGESHVKLAIPPATVSALSLVGSRTTPPASVDAAPLRLTVLLHAAPLFPRRTRLRSRDMSLLLGTLSSLLERLPVRSVRLVVFNLAQQRELFRDDAFTLEALDDVAQSINGLQLETVDYSVLQNRHGAEDLLAGLLKEELRLDAHSDAVVFLGPPAGVEAKVPRDALERTRDSVPRLFYLQYRPYVQPGAEYPDAIGRAVAILKGKAIAIHSPGDFAKAIEEVGRH